MEDAIYSRLNLFALKHSFCTYTYFVNTYIKKNSVIENQLSTTSENAN